MPDEASTYGVLSISLAHHRVMEVNLNQIAVFHAVAEAGTVTAGAERLGITQPAVSKQIKELERGGLRTGVRRGRKSLQIVKLQHDKWRRPELHPRPTHLEVALFAAIA
jgi:DNA-binding MarR family transcriptional regulator